MAEVLILDDDEQFCRMLAEYVRSAGHGVSAAHTLAEGISRFTERPFDIGFLGVRLPDGSGLDILPEMECGVSPPDVILVAGNGDEEGVELVIKHGAWDWVRKGSSTSQLKLALARALQHREIRRGATGRALFHAPGMIGHSPSFRHVIAQAAQAAECDVGVVLTGEAGSGKELCAVSIHENSARASGPFIVADCAALPGALIGGILFSHARGASAGANGEHGGLIVQAKGGTLFVDEVEEMPMDIQKALLRAIQERSSWPVDGETLGSDFRVIAATRCDMEELVARGAFRQDLLQQLSALTVRLPPLRERMEDIPPLTTHLVAEQCQALGMDMLGIRNGFIQTLSKYDWPGNVRELAQATLGAVVRAGADTVLSSSHLPSHIRAGTTSATSDTHISRQSLFSPAFSGDLAPLREMRTAFEKTYLQEMVKQAHRDIGAACRISGLSRPHVYALLKKHGLRL